MHVLHLFPRFSRIFSIRWLVPLQESSIRVVVGYVPYSEKNSWERKIKTVNMIFRSVISVVLEDFQNHWQNICAKNYQLTD